MDTDKGNAEGEAPTPQGKLQLPEESVGSFNMFGTERPKVELPLSEVWNHLYKVVVKSHDDTIQTKAQCMYCNEMLPYDSQCGIYHLKLHSEECITKITANIRKEEQLSELNVGGRSTFDQAIACAKTVRLIICCGHSFSWAESGFFLEFARELNPLFKSIPRRNVENIVLKFFKEEKPVLKNLLRTLPGKICLASNLWESNVAKRYMCIIAHYVDSDWKLNKRMIGFPMLGSDDYPMLDDYPSWLEIFEGIYNTILDWEIDEKILTITLDRLVPSDVSSKLKEELLLNGSSLHQQLFHVSCGTYMLSNLIQEELEGFSLSLHHIRESIKHVSSGNNQQFTELCKDEGLQVRRLPLDFQLPQLRWNTTYLMLDAVIPYRRVFEKFVPDSDFEDIPLPLDWKNATVLRDILKVFCEATKLCSGIRYVSSSVFLHQLSNIFLVISQYEDDPCYTSMVVKMKSKIKEYLGDRPLALGLAACVDPRYKLPVLEVCLEVIYGYEETHRSGGLLEIIKCAFKELCAEYKQILVKKDTLTREDDPTHREESSQSVESEMQLYLDQPSAETGAEETFDVLGWWKAQESCYPVLSTVARDLLTIPVSSVPLESAFTTGERVLNDNRMVLPAKVVEASVCLKDWYEAEEGSQDAKFYEIENMLKDENWEDGDMDGIEEYMDSDYDSEPDL